MHYLLPTLPTFMTRQILNFLDYHDYTTLRPTCTRFAALWQQALETGRMTGRCLSPRSVQRWRKR